VFRDSPASNKYNFPEDPGVESLSSRYNHVSSSKIQIPGDIQKAPAPLIEPALEEQMEECLFQSG
jgi:hypothetical protein